MRLFIAVSVPKEEQERIHRVTRPLRELDFPVRWVSWELFHLTLKFLGEVPRASVGPIEEVMEDVAARTPPFAMKIAGFGAFPTIRRPRVLWVGVDPSPAVRCLKQDLEWAFSDLGFEREPRAFHPHLTLGRAKPGDGAGAFRGLDALASGLEYSAIVDVRQVELMRSHLSGAGPRYEVLSSFVLSGPERG